MDKKPNVTGTGIAVGVAVIIVIGLLFFGKQIFGALTTNYSTTGTTTALGQTMQAQPAASAQTTNPATNPTSMTDSNTASVPSDIPADVTQLMTKDEVVGTGAEAKAGDSVTVQYVGMLTDGTVFDASANHGTTGFTFNLGAGQVIKGWDEGVVGMKVGGKRELIIPASLGYGSQAVGTIPPNSTLVFEVELQNVQPGTAQ
jgi:FKBP-type peptidyl-prolyl cis-trans isomerase